MEKKDDSINIQTTNKYNGENNREEEKEENINQEQHQLKSRADKIFLETKQKIIIKDKILYVQMVGFFQKSATFFKEKISMEQITNKKKQSCCHFECKIMLVFLSGTLIATMFVSSAKFFELQFEVSEVQSVVWLWAYFLPWPHFSTLFFQSHSIDYDRSPSKVWHIEHHMAEILESKICIGFSDDLEMWSTY